MGFFLILIVVNVIYGPHRQYLPETSKRKHEGCNTFSHLSRINRTNEELNNMSQEA